MKTVTVTEARRHFGALLKDVQHEPVLIFRRNGTSVVFVSIEEYERIRRIANSEPACPKLTRKTAGSRKQR